MPKRRDDPQQIRAEVEELRRRRAAWVAYYTQQRPRASEETQERVS
jgi:hypothetical protein